MLSRSAGPAHPSLIFLLVTAAVLGATGLSRANPGVGSEAKAASPSARPEGSGAAAASASDESPSSGEAATTSSEGENSFAIFELETSEASLEAEARSVAALIGIRLSERPGVRVLGLELVDAGLGEERSRLRGCRDAACYREIGEKLDVDHVVQGRLDKFGDGYVLTATVTEARAGSLIVRVREQAEEEIDFPWAADRLGDGIGNAVGLEERSIFDLTLAGTDDPTAHVNVKFGNTIAALKGFNIDTFTLQFDLEADYYLRRYLLAYLEAGLAVGRVSNEGEESKGTFSLVPVTIGLKYVLFHQREVRPYTGLGLGLGLIGDLVEPEDRKLSLHFKGLIGIAYVPWRALGFNFETSVNFDELKMQGGSSLLVAFNANFGVLVIF